MKIRLLPVPLILGALVLLVGSIFSVMHWPGGKMMLLGGSFQETLFLALSLIEIGRSKNAPASQKKAWFVLMASLYLIAALCVRGLLLPVYALLSGIVYLGYGRKKIFSYRELQQNIVFSFETEETTV